MREKWFSVISAILFCSFGSPAFGGLRVVAVSEKRPSRQSSHEEVFLKQPDVKLWYRQPANDWLHALPVGNGRLGGMVFGGVPRERIQVNEESLWAGQSIDNNNPHAREHLAELQKLLLAERVPEAEKLVAKYFIGTPPRIRSYETAGDIFIDLDGMEEIGNYRRELQLETGVARTSWTRGETKYVREVFASAPDDALVIRMTADGPDAIDAAITMTRGKDATVAARGSDMLVMTGQIIDSPDPLRGPGGAHMRFAEILKTRQRIKGDESDSR
jgi:alpha-L-fucosidase 2